MLKLSAYTAQKKNMYTYIGVYRGIILMAAGNVAADDCDKE